MLQPQSVWGWLIALYLFLAGVGAGASLTAWWARRLPHGAAVQRVGGWLAGPLVAVGTMLLVLDLGAGRVEPWRILWLYSHPASVMTIGTWLLTLFIPVSLLRGFAPRSWRVDERIPWLGTVEAILALGVALYTGVLLGVLPGITLWNNGLLPVLFLVSAASTGMGATLAVAGFLEGSDASTDATLDNLHIGVITAEATVLALWLLFAANTGAAGSASFALITSGDLAPLFWAGVVGSGLVLPLLLAVTIRRRAASALNTRWFHMAEGLAILLGGFLLRYIVVSAGIPEPILAVMLP